METKTIYIASDHAGFTVKQKIIKIVKKLNYKIEDLGPLTDEKPVDYSDYAKIVAKKIQKNENSYGILICGSGTGMQIAANKFKGIRAAFVYDKYSAQMARFDNNANILTLRARKFSSYKYSSIVKTFIETKFSNFIRHKRRLEKLEKLEKL